MSLSRTLGAALVAAAALALAAPAAFAAQGPDYVTSDNVEYLGFIKNDIGQTTGSRIVGNRLYVTSAKNLSIYDISNPATPTLMGTMKVNIAWENEEVPTNGKILGIANDWFDLQPNCALNSPGAGTVSQVQHCQQLFDVRDPANIKELPAIPTNADHTSECAYDCHYLFGSKGNITSLAGVLDGGQPHVLGNWQTLIKPQLAARGFSGGVKQCHHIREIKPGFLFAACQPFVYFSVDESDAGVLAPTVHVIGSNADNRFVHSVRWPRAGEDKFAFQGGETNFTGDETCDGTNTDYAAFSVLDASHADETGKFSQPIDEYRVKAGKYTDGNTATEIAGCSVHWFQEHPSFHNGGLIALAAYDNGIRFLQITPDGKIKEQGFFQPLGFETSAPRWVPGTDIIYSIDYARGIDILRWKGSHYVPDENGVVQPEPGTTPGTRGKLPVFPALTKKQRAFAVREVGLLHAQGWFKGYCQLAASR